MTVKKRRQMRHTIENAFLWKILKEGLELNQGRSRKEIINAGKLACEKLALHIIDFAGLDGASRELQRALQNTIYQTIISKKPCGPEAFTSLGVPLASSKKICAYLEFLTQHQNTKLGEAVIELDSLRKPPHG